MGGAYIMKKNSSFFWWVPALILLSVLYPMGLKAFDGYIAIGMTSIGIFALWLAMGYFVAFDVPDHNNQAGFVFCIIALLYNPVSSSYTLANMLAAKNHLYVVILNIIVAAIFMYYWWIAKKNSPSKL